MNSKNTLAVDQVANQQIRPTKVAIIHASSFADSNLSHDGIHNTLTALFSPLKAQVFSVLELGETGLKQFCSSKGYDVVGLVGNAHEFSSLRRGAKFSSRDGSDDAPIVLSFTSRTRFMDSKKYLDFSDAVILCEAVGEDWPLKVFQIVYHLFESLVVPSMMNIDLADVKRIAKRIGLAFNLFGDDHEKIIEMLPKDCFVARSAILHFSCTDDVRLGEIYSISKSIALKKGFGNGDPQLSSHSDARKMIRSVNVKMGIRIIEDHLEDSEKSSISTVDNLDAFQGRKRISMTAILFGI